MPWVIPPWLALVEFLGLAVKEYDEHDDDKATMWTMTVVMMTTMAVTPTIRMAATMEITTKVTRTAMAPATTTTTTMTSTTTMTMMGRQQCNGDNDSGTTTI